MYSDSQSLAQNGEPAFASFNPFIDDAALTPAAEVHPEPPALNDAPSCYRPPEQLPSADATVMAQIVSAADPVELPAERLLSVVWKTSSRIHQVAVHSTKTGTWRNETVIGIPAAVLFTRDQSAAGNDTYLAMSEFLDHKSRKSDNVASASAWWVDIDCGEEKAAAGKGYRDATEARAALDEFCARNGFPAPTHIVESGGGLHAYWAINQPLERAAWIAAAGKLKAVARACNFLADPSRTADIASVLRMPGTLNYKYSPPRRVRLLSADAPLSRDALVQLINNAYQRLCIATAPLGPVGNSNIHPPGNFPPPFGLSDLLKLQSALKHLDPDCDDETWKLRRIAPAARAARDYPELAAQLQALMRAWSSGELRGQPSLAWAIPGASNGKSGEEVFESTWNRFLTGEYSGQPVTVATIFHDALEAGWEDVSTEFQVLDTPTVLVEAEADRAKEIMQSLIARVQAGDVGAPLEPESVAALTALNPAEYQRTRLRLKQANKSIGLTAIDNAVKAEMTSKEVPETHHGYAVDIIGRLTVGGWAPVGHEGTMYVLDPESKIWTEMAPAALAKFVAETHDGKDNCQRIADYRGIADYATSFVSDESFFAQAPLGFACPAGFYEMVNNEVQLVPLAAVHRQRVMFGFSPAALATPLFDGLLSDTFKSPNPGEELEQIFLLQELAGAIVFGLMPRFHRVFLFYEPIGRAGKGTVATILTALVPASFVRAVSPMHWDNEYYLVQLAGARLNIVGELPDDKSIPAAAFKTVIGGDLMTGRHPAGRPISFKNGAAHVISSNHLINSHDQGEAFFIRWIILHFPNSRLVSGLPLDTTLASRIIEQELPGIAHWAFEGAARLLRNNGFSKSAAHDRQMQKWRRCISSVEEFIHECCEQGSAFTVRKAEFYAKYREWCPENGRKAFSKSRVKELLANNVPLGVSLSNLDGYEIFRGLRFKLAKDMDPYPFTLHSDNDAAIY